MIEPGLECRVGVITPLSPENQHHLSRSLRLSDRDEIHVVDRNGDVWRGFIVAEGARIAFLPREVVASGPGAATGRMFVMMLPALKSDRTEWAIQKSVEVGVGRLCVISYERSVRRFDARTINDRMGRYLRVAVDAARQCGRTDVPEMKGYLDLGAAVCDLPPELPRYFLDERTGGPSLASTLAADSTGAIMAVGPEGSFSDREYKVLQDAGFVGAGLGPRILRAETAVVAAIVVAQTVAGDMV